MSVTKDGIRFLKVILSTAFLYRPQIIVNTFSFFFFLISTLIMIQPIFHYFSYQSIADWMIYRFVFASVLSVLSVILFSFSFFMQNAVKLSLNIDVNNKVSNGLSDKFFNSIISTLIGFLFLISGFSLISGSLMDRFSSGHTNEHWSRYIAFLFFEVNGLLILLTRWSRYIFILLRARLAFVQSDIYDKL